MREAYPRLYRAVAEMIPNVVLSLPTARKIARRADLRNTGGGPRTVMEGIIHPDEEPRARVWPVELGAAAFVRMHSRSNIPVYLNYLLSDNDLDVGAIQLYATDEFAVEVPISASRDDADLNWLRLPLFPPSDPVRLILGMGEHQATLDADALDGPFSVALQIK